MLFTDTYLLISRWGGGNNIKTIKKILVPYFLYAFILGCPLSLKSLLYFSYGSIQSIAKGLPTQQLWFLPCYLVAVLFFNIIEKYNKKGSYWYSAVVVLLSGFISSNLDITQELIVSFGGHNIHFTGFPKQDGDIYIGMPLGINTAFSAIVFIYIGYFWGKIATRLQKSELNKWYCAIGGTIMLLTGYLLYPMNQGAVNSSMHMVVMSYALYGNYLLFVLTAFLCSVGVILLSVILDNKYMSRFGQDTLFIFAFHFVALATIRMALSKIPVLSVNVIDPTVESLISSTLTIILLCLIIPFIKRFIPNLFGIGLNK